ncbi:xanthine dehydrogenase family protein molybdopterin-binding subunit [Paracandidimonas soli]|uniref:xanthine dehydrogenase family protein molybdopterin-binding subunit n=1 Tax=Paracandidimonas soli TaxID=1917182 RepID=UPI00333FE0A5
MSAEEEVAVSTYVGRRVARIEDDALLRGRGQYGDDAGVKPGTLYAAVVRSAYAHARLLGVDASRALEIPGVRAVLTGEDVAAWSRPFVVGVKQPMRHYCLAVDRVRYVGEPVAVVVAEDRYLAEDGADRVTVNYDPLPAAVEIDAALAEDAPVLHEEVGSNVVSERLYCYGDPDTAFAQADHRIGIEVEYPRNSCTPIETAVVVAQYLSATEGYDAQSNFMGPYSLHTVMALALQVSGPQLRHRCFRDSGGSFGVKQAVFPYVVLMCLASRKAGGAPVKWVEDRLEHLLAATSATGRQTKLAAAVSADGRILALDYDQVDDCGGYLRAPEPASFYRMHGCLTGPYDVQNLRVRNRIALTNKMPTGLVRGFGGPQVYFALERLVQRIANTLGLDPLDVYRRNLVGRNAFPYRAAAGALLDSGDYHGTLAHALARGGLDELRARREAARAQGRLYGIGFAAIVEPSISNMGYISVVLTHEQRERAGPKNGAIASATVSIDPLGGVTVVVASAPAGQGHRTVCAQVAADVFGLTPQQVTVNVDFDTQKDAWSVAAGNYSSRFSGAVAGVVHLAATRLRDKVARIAAAQWKCCPEDIVFAGGQVRAGADGPSQPFGRLAAGPHWAPGLLPPDEEPGLRETAFWTPPQLEAPDAGDRVNTSAAYGFVFDICAVEVDPDTGGVRIDRYATTHDAGRLLNPMLADGQIRGAFAQGLGAALMEGFQYGSDGSFLSGTFADYLVPTACEVPDPVISHQETLSPFTPLGAKGLGEGNNMSTPVCVANAVADALGVKDVSLPLTPSRVMALLAPEDPPPSRPVASTGPSVPGKAGKNLSASGEVKLVAPPEAVFAVLLDPEALARVIPGCHKLQEIGPHRYRADVTVGVGMVKARYSAEVTLSELDPPNSLRLSGKGLSSMGAASGSGMVKLDAEDGGTRLRYDYEAEVSGKVAAVGGRMLEGAARIVLAQLFEQLGRQAGGEPADGSWWRRLLARLGLKR